MNIEHRNNNFLLIGWIQRNFLVDFNKLYKSSSKNFTVRKMSNSNHEIFLQDLERSAKDHPDVKLNYSVEGSLYPTQGPWTSARFDEEPGVPKIWKALMMDRPWWMAQFVHGEYSSSSDFNGFERKMIRCFINLIEHTRPIWNSITK